MSGRGKHTKESLTPNSESRRTSCFLEVPKDSQFRSRSKSLDDGATRKTSPTIDSATAYKIYDEILKEGKVILFSFFFFCLVINLRGIDGSILYVWVWVCFTIGF